MSMADHIKQQVLQEFFAEKVSFSWKTTKLDSSVFNFFFLLGPDVLLCFLFVNVHYFTWLTSFDLILI